MARAGRDLIISGLLNLRRIPVAEACLVPSRWNYANDLPGKYSIGDDSSWRLSINHLAGQFASPFNVTGRSKLAKPFTWESLPDRWYAVNRRKVLDAKRSAIPAGAKTRVRDVQELLQFVRVAANVTDQIIYL